MRAPARPVMLALASMLACAPAERSNPAEEQGRAYTEWFYGQEFDKLWAKLSPEMQGTFGTPQGLAAFAGETVRQLGPETGTLSEVVAREDTVQVYTRRATFERGQAPMLLQWTLTSGGTVTGFVVRPDVGQTPG